MTVKEIVEKYLRDNRYDGLCHTDSECGCSLGDLVPCCEDCTSCEPGYKAPCDCGDHDYHIVTKKHKGEGE